jgi:hypothetical protein
VTPKRTTGPLLDFIYLDLPRLESVASQLIDGGVPESKTRTSQRESAFDGEVSGGLPFIATGSAGTRAVLSASSTVTSRYHHRLVVEVIEQLRTGGFLHELQDDPVDGSFVHLSGELQVVDPRLLARFMEAAPDLQGAVAAFSQQPAPEQKTKADRRAGRSPGAAATTWPAKRQTESMKKILDIFAPDSARIRIISGENTVAVGVVERDKFVEDLERLIGRHGQLFGGQWSVLAQTNARSTKPLQKSQTTNIYDLIESGGADLIETLSQLSGTGASGLRLTPLAIYREISPKT